MKWTLLVAIAIVALATSVVLGPAAVPLSELARSDIVWNLRAPRAVLAFAVGAFAAAITTAIVSLADAAELRNAFLWLWGGLSAASWQAVLLVALYVPVPLLVLVAAARPLDLLALGEEPARYLGADVDAVKRRVYVAASLLTAAAGAVSGGIGFVGLVGPHIARLSWGD